MALEDFTTYTETDEGADVTVTSTKVDYTNLLTRDDDARVRKDMGAAFFDGDFYHTFESYFANSDVYALAWEWGLAESAKNQEDIVLDSESAISFVYYNHNTQSHTFRLRHIESGAQSNQDFYDGPSPSTLYYISMTRDHDGGVNSTGRYRAYICTGDYYGEGGSVVDVLNVDASAGEQNDYRYVFALNTNTTGAGANPEVDGYTQNLRIEQAFYYYNAKSTSNWNNSANMIDGDLFMYADTFTDGTTETLTGTNCDGTDIGTITKVEMRVRGMGDGDDEVEVTPSGGSTYTFVPVASPVLTWTDWQDVSADYSSWDDIQNLDVNVVYDKVGKGAQMNVYQVELRVTYDWVEITGSPWHQFAQEA
jgi:hypothetical protein